MSSPDLPNLDAVDARPIASGDPRYRVALDVYTGPMDLLLFLIRRHEVDIYDIPIAKITEQYIQYVELLKEVDPEVVSEFLVLAATLMEIKSRTLLPHPPVEDDEEEQIDPRSQLVRQLLEYKKYKDAARWLEASAADHARKHARAGVLASRAADEISLDSVDIWNLFEAFNKLLIQIGKAGAVHKITVDDTPVRLHAEDIIDSLQRAGGEQLFEEIFAGRDRAQMIGLFLALLELIRRRRVQATQERALGDIHIRLLDPTPLGETDEESESTDPFDAELMEEASAPIKDVEPPPRDADPYPGQDPPGNGATVAHLPAVQPPVTTDLSHDSEIHDGSA